eukprot:PhF_6_TR39040/c0_g1_i1/m.58426
MFRKTIVPRIHTFYGGVGWTKKRPFLTSYFGQAALRSHSNTNFAEVDHPEVKSEQGKYLYSAIEYDLSQLGKVDWTSEFDSFWTDQVQGHQQLFNTVYTENATRLEKLFIGDLRSADHDAERKVISKKLNELRSMLHWATETEKVFTAIYDTRFHMQREVWDAVERERMLLGCAEAYTNFCDQVPSVFQKKATKELLWHLMTMRHWVWDCPNAKRVYSRLLA